MLDSKLKDSCRICSRELCGNHRRWIFHPAAKINLQTLLSHALGREVTRDGRGEFACGKCAFVLERMYRFDTVIARVEALSIERMQKLLLEKERLRQGVGALYWKNNTSVVDPGADGVAKTEALGDGGGAMDIATLSEMSYSALLQEDLTYSVFESWAEQESTLDYNSQQSLHTQHHHHHTHSRKCRGCAALRVADSDYEAVCKLPRRLRSTSCGPPTRFSGSAEEAGGAVTPAQPPEPSPLPAKEKEVEQGGGAERMSPSPASSVESLETLPQDGGPAMNQSTHPPKEEVVRVERSSSPTELVACQPYVNTSELDGSGAYPSGLESGSIYSVGLELALSLTRSCQYRPVQSRKGSRLPVRVKPKPGLSHESLPHGLLYSGATDCPLSPLLLLEGRSSSSRQGELQHELAEMDELWLDEFTSCRPAHLQEVSTDLFTWTSVSSLPFFNFFQTLSLHFPLPTTPTLSFFSLSYSLTLFQTRSICSFILSPDLPSHLLNM